MAVAALVILLAARALAGPLEDAQTAHDAGDYTTTLRLFQPLAEQGEADADYGLGRMYLFGNGVPGTAPKR